MKTGKILFTELASKKIKITIDDTVETIDFLEEPGQLPNLHFRETVENYLKENDYIVLVKDGGLKSGSRKSGYFSGDLFTKRG